MKDINVRAIRDRYAAVCAQLDERGRRLFAAAEARSAGYGGIAAAVRATGIAASTIGRGLKELALGSEVRCEQVRRAGGGRKALTASDGTLLEDLMALVSPVERGDPMSGLRWTCKSLRRLAGELGEKGHKISHTVVGELLKQQKFSLQGNHKSREGENHPDRDAQFAHIDAQVKRAMAERQPVISVDTKKKELVGDFKNAGREWCPQGDPEQVRVHDFLIKELGRAVPYGIYDLASNTGWVSVGIDHDTATFAVQTIRSWWHEAGAVRYPGKRHLTITADGGGSNGARVRLWKYELQQLADELGIDITVHHFPPGSSSRVEVWRGCCRPNISVSAPFVWRCLSGSTLAPSPHPARQTGHADRPHPAFSCVIKPSRLAGQRGATARRRGRVSDRDTRPDTGDIRCPLVRRVASTSVADAAEHTNAPSCRSEVPALG